MGIWLHTSDIPVNDGWGRFIDRISRLGVKGAGRREGSDSSKGYRRVKEVGGAGGGRG